MNIQRILSLLIVVATLLLPVSMAMAEDQTVTILGVQDKDSEQFKLTIQYKGKEFDAGLCDVSKIQEKEEFQNLMNKKLGKKLEFVWSFPDFEKEFDEAVEAKLASYTITGMKKTVNTGIFFNRRARGGCRGGCGGSSRSFGAGATYQPMSYGRGGGFGMQPAMLFGGGNVVSTQPMSFGGCSSCGGAQNMNFVSTQPISYDVGFSTGQGIYGNNPVYAGGLPYPAGGNSAWNNAPRWFQREHAKLLANDYTAQPYGCGGRFSPQGWAMRMNRRGRIYEAIRDVGVPLISAGIIGRGLSRSGSTVNNNNTFNPTNTFNPVNNVPAPMVIHPPVQIPMMMQMD